MVSRNMLHSIRESRFVVDSFVEEDSEWQRDDDDDEDEKEDNPPDSNAVVKAVSKETKKVRMWRYIVIFILLVAGGSTSALTYLILHGAEEEDFNTSVRISSGSSVCPSLSEYILFLIQTIKYTYSTHYLRIPSETLLLHISGISKWYLMVLPRRSQGLLLLREKPSHLSRSPCLKSRANTAERRRVLKR